jgi:predicted DNA-binding ribbon-helix-helix protein
MTRTALKEIASESHLTVSDMVSNIDRGRRQGNLSSAIRLFVLDHYRAHVGDNEFREASSTHAPTALPRH